MRPFSRPREALESRRHGVERQVFEAEYITRVSQSQPVLVDRELVRTDAVRTEGMEVNVAQPRPVAKLDAELERRLGSANEIVFVEPEHAVEEPDRRDGRLADTDGADLR